MSGDVSFSERLGTCRHQYELAEYETGLELAQRLLGQVQATGDTAGELVVRQLIVTGHRWLGQYETAIEAAEILCQRASQSGERLVQLEGLHRLGHLYLDINKAADAMKALDQGVGLDLEQNEGRLYGRFAASLADVYMKVGHYEKAEFMCHRALMHLQVQFDEALDLLCLPAARRTLYERKITLARAAEAMGQYRRAIYLLEGVTPDHSGILMLDPPTRQAAIASYQREFDHIVRFHQGRLYRRTGQSDVAEESLTASSRLAQTVGDVPVQMLAEEELGFLDLETEAFEAALNHFAKGISLLEGHLHQLRVEEFRLSLRETGKTLYMSAIEACLELQDITTAWGYSEQARARVFLNMIGNLDILRRSPRVAGDGDDYADVSRQLSILTRRLFEARSQGEMGLARQLEQAYEEQMGRKVELVQAMRRQSPLDASLVEVPVVTMTQLAASLDEESCVVEYFVADDSVTIFFLSRTETECYRVPIKRETLGGMIGRLRGAIRSSGRSSAEEAPQQDRADGRREKGSLRQRLRRFRRRPSSPSQRDIQVQARSETESAGSDDETLALLSRQLYQLLIQPYQEKLSRYTRICLIPHDALTYLPFASLKAESYLIEQVQVVYEPSGSILHTLLKGSAKPAPEKILVFANPQQGDTHLALPYAEEEASRIADLLPQAQTFIGSDAQITRFSDEALDSDVIHLACHARFDENHPLLSFLLLAADEATQHGGHLEVHQISGLALQAGLVVLSACETAMSDLSGGNEYTGLIRAFMTAGASTVIASNWKVDDMATAQLMASLYRYHLMGMDKGESLRKAQLDMLRDPGHAHPYYWSAFSVYGDWR